MQTKKISAVAAVAAVILLVLNSMTGKPAKEIQTDYSLDDWQPVASLARTESFDVRYDKEAYNRRPIVASSKRQLPVQQIEEQFRMNEDDDIGSFNFVGDAGGGSGGSSVVIDGPAPAQDPVVDDLVDDLDNHAAPIAAPIANMRTETRYRQVKRFRQRQVCGPMGTCRIVNEPYFVNEAYEVQVSDPVVATAGGCGCGCANCNCAPPTMTQSITYSSPTITYSPTTEYFTELMTADCVDCTTGQAYGTARTAEGNFVPIRTKLFGSGRFFRTWGANIGSRMKARKQNRVSRRATRLGVL